MALTTSHFIGMAAALILVFGIGLISSRQVHNSADFTVSGRRAGPFLVMGALLGTLVGGSCTIGTAQLAFLYGFSAWWFTLGGGIACLFMALFLVRPMRQAGLETVPQFWDYTSALPPVSQRPSFYRSACLSVSSRSYYPQ